MNNQEQYQTQSQDIQDQQRHGVSPAFIAKVIAEQQSKEQHPRH